MDLFISSDTTICCTVGFLPLENSEHVVVSVSIDFLSDLKLDVPFYHIAYDYSRTDWDGFCDYFRDV